LIVEKKYFYQNKHWSIGLSRWGPRGHGPTQIFRIFGHFVLWEAISQAKYCG